MSRNDAIAVTLYDVIGSGLVCGFGPRKTLELWRVLGGQIRDADFFEEYHRLAELYRHALKVAIVDASSQADS